MTDLNKIWTPYSANNPQTHPKTDVAPSGEFWAVIRDGVGLKSYTWNNQPNGLHWQNVICYCDPADLTPDFVNNFRKAG